MINIFSPPGGPPQTPRPSPEIYGIMGEENIFKMLYDFYVELGNSDIKAMFPADLKEASEKSAAFFVGFLGGPPLYHQRYGNPMMRARHMKFPINAHARQVWLDCFDKVLENATEDYNFPAEHLPDFKAFLHGFSTWMVNREG